MNENNNELGRFDIVRSGETLQEKKSVQDTTRHKTTNETTTEEAKAKGCSE